MPLGLTVSQHTNMVCVLKKVEADNVWFPLTFSILSEFLLVVLKLKKGGNSCKQSLLSNPRK